MLPMLLVVTALVSPTPGPLWGWPLAGTPVVDRAFDPPRTTYGAGHRGVDLRAAAGTAVRAAGAGTVSYVGLLAGRGVVTVTHTGGLRTTYEPVASSVRLGETVGLGARLGTVTTGHASCRLGTTCLHWGLLRGATYLDPLSLLGLARVRLLPLGARAHGGARPDGARRDGRVAHSTRAGQAGPTPWRPTPSDAAGAAVTTLVVPAAAVAVGAGAGVVVARRRRQRGGA